MLEASRFFRLNPQLTKFELCLSPHEIFLSLGSSGVRVLFYDLKSLLFRIGCTQDEEKGDPLTGSQGHLATQAQYRIEDVSDGTG
jgi:hypothetical protein